jgi:phage gp16-like protein
MTTQASQFDKDQAELVKANLTEYQRAVYRTMRNHGYTHREALREAAASK